MANPSSCPNCGLVIGVETSHCPQCGISLDPFRFFDTQEAELRSQLDAGSRLSPDALVYRLGDYLIENGMLTPEALQKALTFQKVRLAEGKQILLGQALLDLGLIDREALDQVTMRQLLSLQAALRDANRQLEQRVQQRTQDLERRLVQIRTAAEVTQIAISAASLSELLRRAVNLIAERFGYYQAGVFLLDETGKSLVLIVSSGLAGQEPPVETRPAEGSVRIKTSDQSIVSWVVANNRPRVVADVTQDPYYLRSERLDDTRSEVGIPLTVGDRAIGVLDVQHTIVDAFDPDAVAVLQTLANHIASVIQNFRLLETAQSNLEVTSIMYQASQRMSQATTSDEIFETVRQTLEKVPFLSLLVWGKPGAMQVDVVRDAETPAAAAMGALGQWADFSIDAPALKAFFAANRLVVFPRFDNAAAGAHPLLQRLLQLDCKSLALVPIVAAGNPEALVVLGSRHENVLTETVVQPYASLAQLAATAFEKVGAQQKLERRLAALQMLNAVSQALSVETDLYSLYQAIHREVRKLMGEVDFAIADYNAESQTIQVPYMYEANQVSSVDAFPLGEGLTSIVIRNHQPLMFVHDTENQVKALGAIYIGRPAKSWLGVPLIISGQAIGAIIVQDLEQEDRFDEEDQSLLSTLASQVAIAVRNARLLEQSYRQAERERQLYEVTSKIRNSVDIQTILSITTAELSKALKIRRAHIEVGLEPSLEPVQTSSMQDRLGDPPVE